jgi:hypothetical protein
MERSTDFFRIIIGTSSLPLSGVVALDQGTTLAASRALIKGRLEALNATYLGCGFMVSLLRPDETIGVGGSGSLCPTPALTGSAQESSATLLT